MNYKPKLFLNISPLLTLCLISIFSACKQQKDKNSAEQIQDNWYRNPLIYNLDVDAFKDSNGDGIGDFNGLTQKLGYIDSLGVKVIWLAPFQPTSNQDDGYDITDYYGVDKRLGTEADFRSFMTEAKKRGLRIIMDAVLNHTSIDHPWFKSSRKDSTSKYYSWYVWSSKKPKDWDKGMVFPGTQTETWTYDEINKKYYFHRFYDFQPDLNYENREVKEEAYKVLQYWLKQGMDGFRLDAVPFIVDIPRTGSANPDHLFNILTELRNAVRKIKPDALLLGEANVTAEENEDYFGKNGERLQMMFNFYADQLLFYALAKGEPAAFSKALEDFRQKPASSQWAFFLRNHDEIDLGRLSKSQRQAVYDKFGRETNMQLYERGIRRRLAPMLSDPELIKMSYSVLFSLPGAPVIRYGEEIGMGDDLTLRERLSVRTPMQWNNLAMAGFSTGKTTFRPVITLGEYGYDKINVSKESSDSTSLLTYIKGLTKLREQHPEIGLGNWKILTVDANPVLVIQYSYQDKNLIAIHNFSKEPQEFSLDKQLMNDFQLRMVHGHTGSTQQDESKFAIPGYGAQWYVASKK